MATANAGYKTRVLISNTALRAHRFSVDWKVDDFDTTSFVNFGVGQYTPGITDFDLAMDCYWFQSDNPHGSAGLNIRPGAFTSCAITFDRNQVTTKWNFPSILVLHCREEGAARDVIRYNVALRISGDTAAQVTGITGPGTASITAANLITSLQS